MHRAVDYAYNREKGGERMKIAIVTGASSGLGMAFVRRLDALGGLDEIWGVARRGERLEALAAELRTPMRPLALDLTRLESVETLRVLMREEEPEVAVLVNADTYSAAEFFAAELQEQGAAVIVGEPTSGKGYSQQTFPLPHGGAVAISTGAYFTGSSASLIGTGLTLDAEVYNTGAEDAQLAAALELLEIR